MISSLEHREKRDKLLASRNYSIHFAPFFLCKLMKFNRTSSVAFPYFLLFSKAQKWTRGDKCSPILIQGSTSCAGFAKRLGLGCRQQQALHPAASHVEGRQGQDSVLFAPSSGCAVYSGIAPRGGEMNTVLLS